jgi:hypothetical protein
MEWNGVVWYGMVWYGMMWYGMVWYGTVGRREAAAPLCRMMPLSMFVACGPLLRGASEEDDHGAPLLLVCGGMHSLTC